MKVKQRLIEMMADVLAEFHVIGGELKELRKDSNPRLDKLENQQAKTNVALGELRLSILKLAERDNITKTTKLG